MLLSGPGRQNPASPPGWSHNSAKGQVRTGARDAARPVIQEEELDIVLHHPQPRLVGAPVLFVYVWMPDSNCGCRHAALNTQVAAAALNSTTHPDGSRCVVARVIVSGRAEVADPSLVPPVSVFVGLDAAY